MHWVRWGVLAAALLLAASCSSGASTTPDAQQPSPGSTPQSTLLSRVPPAGTLPVVVTLAGTYVPEGELADESARQAQRRAIRAAQDAVLAELPSSGVRAVRRFAFTPQLALTVDAAALERLLRSQRVAAVQEDTAQSQHG
ncbi:hypothetical protein [Streptomyces sp. SID13031]|uniref:hypothetical protein n=1 Tax=Streptomyces sp. SID13031 TaxID=2706046 RepID=UPI0013C74C6B|nr:hypothetical protein [Streptomyces sp. SID13031]NEA32826.1 hypothetical protein [Streptomyces sp. SID13031]